MMFNCLENKNACFQVFFYKIVNLFGLLSDQRSLGQLQNEKDGRLNAAWIKNAIFEIIVHQLK